MKNDLYGQISLIRTVLAICFMWESQVLCSLNQSGDALSLKELPETPNQTL